MRPIYVEDMARLVADADRSNGNSVLDAVGPETFTFEELVTLVAQQLGRSVRLIHLPMPLAYLSTLVTGWFVGDVILTWEEYRGLMGDLLAPDGPAAGSTRLSQWLTENHDQRGHAVFVGGDTPLCETCPAYGLNRKPLRRLWNW